LRGRQPARILGRAFKNYEAAKTAIVWLRRGLWIPEPRDVPSEKLAEPPGLGQRLAKNYPALIVDHARAREKAALNSLAGTR
jgi:deoxyribodipyrimidine photolyase